MAGSAVSPRYLSAGAAYLDALGGLGLDPEFLGWGWELAARRWVLVLVTSIIDTGGPVAFNRLLFRASSYAEGYFALHGSSIQPCNR